MNCGTRGVPDTVAPFRAWRGSRDLVAQSPKFHASAVALSRDCEFQFSTARCMYSRAALRILASPRLRALRPAAARRTDSPNSL